MVTTRSDNWLSLGLVLALALLTVACDEVQHATPPTAGANTEAVDRETIRTVTAQLEAAAVLSGAPAAQAHLDHRRTMTAATDGLRTGATGAAPGAGWRLALNGLPRNARQTPEGYWIGAHPTPTHLSELAARGVRVVVSGTRLDRATRAVRDRLGLAHVDLPFGGRFPDGRTLLEGTKGYDNDEIYIHCMHGGDRSGAMLAFLLTAREQWPAEQALLAVAFPGPGDLRRLTEMLREHGLDVDRGTVARFGGIYSPEKNGGFGGLKVRGPSYEKLVRTTLREMRESGVL